MGSDVERRKVYHSVQADTAGACGTDFCELPGMRLEEGAVKTAGVALLVFCLFFPIGGILLALPFVAAVFWVSWFIRSDPTAPKPDPIFRAVRWAQDHPNGETAALLARLKARGEWCWYCNAGPAAESYGDHPACDSCLRRWTQWDSSRALSPAAARSTTVADGVGATTTIGARQAKSGRGPCHPRRSRRP